MQQPYTAWIAAHVTGDVTGQCDYWTRRMVEVFPDLVRVRGHVHPVGVDTTGKPQGYPHWWLVTPDSVIVDPTRQQFPWAITYEPWDETQHEPTGKCLNCGDYCYDSASCCSAMCTREYEAYCMSMLGR